MTDEEIMLEEKRRKEAKELYELCEYDSHVCDFNWLGECTICGALKPGSILYKEIYGGE